VNTKLDQGLRVEQFFGLLEHEEPGLFSWFKMRMYTRIYHDGEILATFESHDFVSLMWAIQAVYRAGQVDGSKEYLTSLLDQLNRP
jgi:hypothetical protein